MNIYSDWITYNDYKSMLDSVEFEKWISEKFKPYLDRKFSRYRARKQLNGDNPAYHEGESESHSASSVPEIFLPYLE